MSETVKSFATFKPAPVTPVFASLQIVERDYGIPPFRQLGQIVRQAILRRRITPMDYYIHRVFANEAEAADALDRYVGDKWRGKVNRALNYEGGKATWLVEDKVFHAQVLAANGFAVPETVGFAHPTRRSELHASLPDQASLARFLRETDAYPLFGKPLEGSLSLGAASLAAHHPEDDTLELSSGARISVDDFAAEAFAEYAKGGYILQRRIAQHPELAEVSGDAVGTIRVLTLRDRAGPEPYYALWKIPQRGSPADNFWRDGHMLALIDIPTGEVRRVQQGAGARARLIETLPDGTPLLGRRIPLWQEVLDTASRAAALTGSLRVMGWDIAVSPEGPVIVEGNTNPDHGLYQMIARQGVLSGRFGELYEEIKDEARAARKEAKRKRRRSRHDDRKRTLAAFRQGTDLGSVVKRRQPEA